MEDGETAVVGCVLATEGVWPRAAVYLFISEEWLIVVRVVVLPCTGEQTSPRRASVLAAVLNLQVPCRHDDLSIVARDSC